MINCNNSIFKKSFLTLLFFMSFIFADPTDGCELETNQVYLTSTGDVLFNSDTGSFEIFTRSIIISNF